MKMQVSKTFIIAAVASCAILCAVAFFSLNGDAAIGTAMDMTTSATVRASCSYSSLWCCCCEYSTGHVWKQHLVTGSPYDTQESCTSTSTSCLGGNTGHNSMSGVDRSGWNC